MKQGMRKTSAERGGALEHLALLECLGFLRDISRGQTVLPNLMQQKIQIMSLDILFVKMLSRRVSPSDPSFGDITLAQTWCSVTCSHLGDIGDASQSTGG